MATEDEQFAAIFREIYPRLCRFLEGLLGDPGGAQDLAQETFLRLHRFGCERLPANESRFWLFRVARNLALNELTRRQTRTKFAASVAAIFSFGSPATATPEEQLAQAEQAQLAARLLVILPADQRAALLLRPAGIGREAAPAHRRCALLPSPSTGALLGNIRRRTGARNQ